MGEDQFIHVDPARALSGDQRSTESRLHVSDNWQGGAEEPLECR